METPENKNSNLYDDYDDDLHDYGSIDHVSTYNKFSTHAFFITLSLLWYLNIPILIIIYLLYCGNLLGDEEEEDREDVVTMDAMMNIVRLEAPRVANRLVDYSHDFLEFYDDIRHNHMKLTAPDVWEYSNMDFNVWLLHDFISTVPGLELDLFDNYLFNWYFQFCWFYNLQWNKFKLYYINSNIASFIDPDYYINEYNPNNVNEVDQYTKFNYFGDLNTRQKHAGTVRGWLNTKQFQKHIIYTRLEESLHTYKAMSTIMYKGLYEIKYSAFLDYFWCEFVDSYKINFDLLTFDEDKFKLYLYLSIDKWLFSFVNYDLTEFCDWLGELGYFGEYKRLYYYNFFVCNYPLKLYFNRKSSIYSFNPKSSYFNLTYTRLPWHSVDNTMGTVSASVLEYVYTNTDTDID